MHVDICCIVDMSCTLFLLFVKLSLSFIIMSSVDYLVFSSGTLSFLLIEYICCLICIMIFSGYHFSCLVFSIINRVVALQYLGNSLNNIFIKDRFYNTI